MGEREVGEPALPARLLHRRKVTNFSGRGVGMDVVRTNIEKIGGTVDIASQLGQGTTVKMKIPLTLAIIPALVVTLGDRRSTPRKAKAPVKDNSIPQVSLLELVRLEGEQARRSSSASATPRLPAARQPAAARLPPRGAGPGRVRAPIRDVVNIVVLQADDRQFGLVVDGIHDTEEIVVKPLEKQLKGLTFSPAPPSWATAGWR